MFYSLFYTLAFCLLFPLLLINKKNRDKYLSTLSQRMGKIDSAINPEKLPAIWVHAVSVGEALAAKSLVARLKETYPEHLVLVSTTTSTGNKIAREELDAHGVFYFPFDWKFAIRRVINAINPQLCIVMETEIWPNFSRCLRQNNIPLLLANGRISDSSFSGYKKFRFLLAPILKHYHRLCAQSAEDAQRLITLGAHPWDTLVSGNLKYNKNQFQVDESKIELLRHKLGIRAEDKVFIAGSTHEKEEDAALTAFAALLKSFPQARLILVPRKPERFQEVAEIISRSGFSWERFSTIEKPSQAQVILIDSIGQLVALYHLSQVAFIGGSLAQTGGHNLLEASSAGVPVLFGPNMHNFREVARDVIQGKAGFQVEDEKELSIRVVELFSDKELYQSLAQAALKVITKNQQALPVTMEAISEAIAWCGRLTKPSRTLKLLSWIHSEGSALIRKTPEEELEQGTKVDVPVISVGGLTFGGAGKTPMVSFLAHLFSDAGKFTCLLTRGYKGQAADPFMVSDGQGNISSPLEGGDEPVMLANSHPKLMVVKDADRIRGARLALAAGSPDIFLLDDGFQYRKIARDINILMLDADSLCSARSGGQLFREPLEFGRCADLIVILAGDIWRREYATAKLSALFPDIPLVDAFFEACKITSLFSGREYILRELEDKTLLALSGIAAPHRFLQTLKKGNLNIGAVKCYPDHHQYCSDDIKEVQALLKLNKCDAIITTEKDALKLLRLGDIVKEMDIMVISGQLNIVQKDKLTKLIEDKIIL